MEMLKVELLNLNRIEDTISRYLRHEIEQTWFISISACLKKNGVEHVWNFGLFIFDNRFFWVGKMKVESKWLTNLNLVWRNFGGFDPQWRQSPL